jgi:hypothetical protein
MTRLEDELRSGRPVLDRSVQRSIARRVQPSGSPMRRTGLALVLTTTTIGAMTALGGVGYAFNTVSHSFNSNSQSNSPGKHQQNSWGTSNGYGGPSSNCQYGNRGHDHKGDKHGHKHQGGNFGW